MIFVNYNSQILENENNCVPSQEDTLHKNEVFH